MQDTRKQIVVRMEQDEIKNLKQFCLDNDLTITDAIKSGIALLKCCNNSLQGKDDGNNYSFMFNKNQFLELAGVGPAKLDKLFF